MALQKITETQINDNGVCSAPDILRGTPAQNKAVFDRMVREIIAPAYNAAVDAINEINQTESGIEAAEALRVIAENLRVEAENARAQEESGRVTAEQARASAENLRAEAENLREAAETARSKAESGRVKAEETRESAEATRVESENQRIENENARIAAEQGRVAAESDRNTAEQARDAAEQARADETDGIVARATEHAIIATNAASEASNSASIASTSASSAFASASSAANSASAASSSETAAKASETTAAGSARSAQESAVSASTSALEASASATAADKSKTSAIEAKTAAETAKTEAGKSASAAKESETASKASETAAAGSANSAQQSASAASESASAAAESAYSIGEAERIVTEKASEASSSAANAAASAEAAEKSAEKATNIVGGNFATKTEAQGYASSAQQAAIDAAADDATEKATAAEQEAKSYADQNISAHISDKTNPHGVTKAQVGLGNVDNTADANKPVSTAQATAIANAVSNHNTSDAAHADIRQALALKQDALSGAEGQLVGFDADGQPTAQDSWQSNRNLLDNWYFGNPSNLGGKTSYTGAVHGIDRWRGVYGSEVVTVADGYVKLTLANNQAIRQVINLPKMLSGKTVTMSILWKLTGSYANMYCNADNVVPTSGRIKKTAAFEKTLDTVTFDIPADVTDINVMISGDGEISMYAVKLEIGNRQTLAHQDAAGNWVLNDNEPEGCEMMLLWENASPGSTFQSQDVNIPNMGEYTFICIKFASDTRQSEYIWSGLGDCTHECMITAHMHSMKYRSSYTKPNRNVMNFDNCKYSTDSNYTSNDYMIPLAVYGVKGIATYRRYS